MLTVNIKSNSGELVYEVAEIHGKSRTVGGVIDHLELIMPDGTTREMIGDRHCGDSVFVMNSDGKTIAKYHFPAAGIQVKCEAA